MATVVALSGGMGLTEAVAGPANSPSKTKPRPNIVLIVADDLGYGDIGPYGGEIRTPHLDKLAGEGMRFTHFYNNAKCTTSRATMLTGLYPRKGGAGIELLDDQMITLAEGLKGHGYQTALSGKWHLGSRAPHRPIDRGFDEFYGLMDGAANYFNPARPDPDFKGGGHRVFGHNDKIIREFPSDFYATDAFTDHAVKTIDRFASNGKPFFLKVAYTAPHYPLHARPADIARYKGRYQGGWEALREERRQKQLALGLVDPRWPQPPLDRLAVPWRYMPHKNWRQQRMEVYAAMVEVMDQGIGRILAALEKADVQDNTLVLFLSDNGGCSEQYGQDRPGITPGPEETYTTVGPNWAWAQNTPFRRYKTWMHEGGVSTPFIVRWPEMVKAGAINHQVGHIIDFMPTFLEMAGGSYPRTHEGHELRPLEGNSLVPLFRGKRAAGGPRTLYWSFWGNAAIRKGHWKAVWDRDFQRWELYDMRRDRLETNDLSQRRKAVLSRLVAAWTRWAKKTGVSLGETGGPLMPS